MIVAGARQSAAAARRRDSGTTMAQARFVGRPGMGVAPEHKLLGAARLAAAALPGAPGVASARARAASLLGVSFGVAAELLRLGIGDDRAASLVAFLRRRWLLAGGAALLVGGVVVAGLMSAPSAPSNPSSTGWTSSSSASSLLGASSGPDFLDLGMKGILVLALLGITLRVLRRVQVGPSAATSSLVVLESRTLAAKASLHLIAVGERRLVVGLTPSGMVSLAELGAADLTSAAPAVRPAGTVPAVQVPATALFAAPAWSGRRTVRGSGARPASANPEIGLFQVPSRPAAPADVAVSGR